MTMSPMLQIPPFDLQIKWFLFIMRLDPPELLLLEVVEDGRPFDEWMDPSGDAAGDPTWEPSWEPTGDPTGEATGDAWGEGVTTMTGEEAEDEGGEVCFAVCLSPNDVDDADAWETAIILSTPRIPVEDAESIELLLHFNRPI